MQSEITITKLNETKVAKAGDLMSGSINYNQTSSGLYWTVDNGDIFFLRPYSHGNILQITKKRNGTEWGAMNFHEDGSFELTAYNGEEGKGAYSLRGAMDGRLLWRDQNMIFVKESWVSGTSWYRVWSDGYIEQGGQTSLVADFATITTTFAKSFSNSNYTVAFSNWRNGTSDDAQWNSAAICNLTTKAAQSFQIYNRGATDGGRYFSWIAVGY